MPDIINPEAIRFSNEVIRPLAEKFRNLKVEVDAALVLWSAGLNTVIGSNVGDTLQDGREDEGVSRLTGADITAFGAEIIAFQTQMEQAGVPEVISKPTVRPMRTN